MAVRYTEEQLNTVDKSLLDPDGSEPAGTVGDPNRRSPFLNRKMQLMMEQMVLANRN